MCFLAGSKIILEDRTARPNCWGNPKGLWNVFKRFESAISAHQAKEEGAEKRWIHPCLRLGRKCKLKKSIISKLWRFRKCCRTFRTFKAGGLTWGVSLYKKNVREVSFTDSYVFKKCKDEQSAVVDIVFNLKCVWVCVHACVCVGGSFVIVS